MEIERETGSLRERIRFALGRSSQAPSMPLTSTTTASCSLTWWTVGLKTRGRASRNAVCCRRSGKPRAWSCGSCGSGTGPRAARTADRGRRERGGYRAVSHFDHARARRARLTGRDVVNVTGTVSLEDPAILGAACESRNEVRDELIASSTRSITPTDQRQRGRVSHSALVISYPRRRARFLRSAPADSSGTHAVQAAAFHDCRDAVLTV